jgi:DNA-binding winged helix-turn-helix (wHTH) protein
MDADQPFPEQQHPDATSDPTSTEHGDLERIADEYGVAIVDWPAHAAQRVGFARAGIARLLLLDADAPLPDDCGIDEDWVRSPVDLDDVRARLERLVRTARMVRSGPPTLVDGVYLRRGALQVSLTPAQARVMAVLIDEPGSTIDRQRLCDAVWPDGDGDLRALDDLVHRMRRRIAGLGVVVRNVRGRGFALDVEHARTASPDTEGDPPSLRSVS